MDGDTIAALSTPLGRGGIAVIRISGPATTDILRTIVEKLPAVITPRRLYHSYIIHETKRIDECMVVYFKAPSSYTGEDVAEISIHSNPFLVEEVMDIILTPSTLTARGETRSALPGEFTYRAFKNGKMDLIQAESVNELINANSKYYAHMKFGTLEGKLSRLLQGLREDLINLGVAIETKIEFEEDQYFDDITIVEGLKAPLDRLEIILTNVRFNELSNKGLNVVIAGKVNVGKSSLFNTLLMEERSIISSIPGTTRDFIKEKLYIDGFPIDITDVAGINRGTKDVVEAQGIKRSMERLKDCDAVIFMLDATRSLDDMDREIYQLIREKKKIIILNKTDMVETSGLDKYVSAFEGERVVEVSVKEHKNIDEVTGFLKEIIENVKQRETDITVNRRQKLALEELRGVLVGIDGMSGAHNAQAEIIAEEIRRGIEIIGGLMGEITPDDILNKIFSEFCIGK
ncbi:MAG: tRNA uridine-5-carboxymethylaminomethyl(34) synthesis GTPase MnmE [bacterium]|nr:tRNA uridine-5-carboxymethylaminomethyl(34) synthesis GTPase MnmE [bacterium]